MAKLGARLGRSESPFVRVHDLDMNASKDGSPQKQKADEKKGGSGQQSKENTARDNDGLKATVKKSNLHEKDGKRKGDSMR